MKQYDMEEQAVKNAYEKGKIDGWNEAIEYINITFEKTAKKKGINTDAQKLSEVNNNDKNLD